MIDRLDFGFDHIERYFPELACPLQLHLLVVLQFEDLRIKHVVELPHMRQFLRSQLDQHVVLFVVQYVALAPKFLRHVPLLLLHHLHQLHLVQH